ncbi:reprolysin-like metallopeptidase [Streptomyces sp. NPDC054866]
MAFLRHKSTGFRCAVACPTGQGWSAMFLRPNWAAGISDTALLFETPTTDAYGGQFTELRQPAYQDFKANPHAVLQLPAHTDGAAQYLFIIGTDSLQYRVGTGVVKREQLVMHSYLPADWQNNVDALLQAPNSPAGAWRTYVFKGSRVITYNWGKDVDVERNALLTEGPDADAPGWAQLPADFRSDLDHVVALPPASGDVRRSLLIKADKGLILNWRTGVEKSGTLTSLTAGLGKLPANYATPYLPLSGTYRATNAGQSVEARIDVDGIGTLSTLSGDLFTVSGQTTTYANSFRSTSVEVGWTDNYVVITGKGLLWATAQPEITQVRTLIYLTAAGQSPSPAAWLTLEDANGYYRSLWSDLPKASTYFRTVDYEVDTVAGEAELVSYDTSKAAVPPGYANRVLTVPASFAEAGVELRTVGTRNVIATTEAGSDLMWSNAELHAAMVAHFSGYREVPQWKLWTLVATENERGSAGVMFDSTGLQRQGMVVFTKANVAGTNDELHTYVHEIGHAFNLMHSFAKGTAVPPAPAGPRNGYGDLSWMNYPQYYQGGSEATSGFAAFFKAFPFSFTDDELRHLRHGFYRNVIMGGNDFMSGAAKEQPSVELFAQPLTDESGLALEIEGQAAFAYGEPVIAQLKLGRTGSHGDVTVTPHLDPSTGHVIVAITDPYGRSRRFQPLTRECAAHTTTTLTAGAPAVYASVYLGYGADGLYFSEPGLYTVAAAYQGPDGSRVVSAPHTIRVRPPLAAADQHIGELLLGEDQGQLLTFLGSDAPQLQSGNDALQEVIERYGDHPLAAHARLARGANAGRHFQHIQGGRLTVREPDIKESVQQLSAAINASTGDEGLDNITLNKAMRRLAKVHAKDGNLAEADAVLNKMVATFRGKHLPAPVQKTIQAQAEETRASIHGGKGKTASRKKK